MVRYHRVTIRHTKEDATKLAKSLGKDLKMFGYSGDVVVVPSKEKVQGGGTYVFYEVKSRATPGQLSNVMRWMNAEKLTGSRKIHKEKDLDPAFRKHLKGPVKATISKEKAELTWRKNFLAHGGKIPKGVVGRK